MGVGYDIGLVGLGTMGRNLALNLAEHGFTVAGHDDDPAKVAALRQLAPAIGVGDDLPTVIAHLRQPRSVWLLVPAGAAVDAVLRELLSLLAPGDLVVDAGNSHFKDTERRGALFAARGIDYVGMGISGGESGARHGPSFMPGGPPTAYERLRPVLEATAARVDAEPCVTLVGPRGAGHYVKMVHNGIEYAVLELIAEAYDLLRRGLGLGPAEIGRACARWQEGLCNSYLLGITRRVLARTDELTGEPLVDRILDEAGQKGTGAWASQEAMDLQVPVPTIDVAVAMRSLSACRAERALASRLLAAERPAYGSDREQFCRELCDALYAAMIVAHAQGFSLLAAGSRAFGYDLALAEIARIWRGGCVIRSGVVESVRTAFLAQPGLPNLLLDPALGRAVRDRQGELRSIVATAVALGIPAPAFAVSLAYFDGYRSERLPANLIQAQRDFFGAHTYRRIDLPGSFHTNWHQD